MFSFGEGEDGQLGHGDHGDGERQLVPKVIEALRGVRVVAIAAGTYHSMVLTDGGDVLTFGYGLRGQLGHGDEGSKPIPRVIESLRGVRVVMAIAAGAYHSMVVTDGGAVLSFGGGDDGELGHGDEEDQFEPKEIEGLRCCANITRVNHPYLRRLVRPTPRSYINDIRTLRSDRRGCPPARVLRRRREC